MAVKSQMNRLPQYMSIFRSGLFTIESSLFKGVDVSGSASAYISQVFKNASPYLYLVIGNRNPIAELKNSIDASLSGMVSNPINPIFAIKKSLLDGLLKDVTSSDTYAESFSKVITNINKYYPDKLEYTKNMLEMLRKNMITAEEVIKLLQPEVDDVIRRVNNTPTPSPMAPKSNMVMPSGGARKTKSRKTKSRKTKSRKTKSRKSRR